MLLSKLKAVPRPVNHSSSLACLKEPKLDLKNRALVQALVSPVTTLKRSCATSCAALSEAYEKLQRYGNAV